MSIIFACNNDEKEPHSTKEISQTNQSSIDQKKINEKVNEENNYHLEEEKDLEKEEKEDLDNFKTKLKKTQTKIRKGKKEFEDILQALDNPEYQESEAKGDPDSLLYEAGSNKNSLMFLGNKIEFINDDSFKYKDEVYTKNDLKKAVAHNYERFLKKELDDLNKDANDSNKLKLIKKSKIYNTAKISEKYGKDVYDTVNKVVLSLENKVQELTEEIGKLKAKISELEKDKENKLKNAKDADEKESIIEEYNKNIEALDSEIKDQPVANSIIEKFKVKPKISLTIYNITLPKHGEYLFTYDINYKYNNDYKKDMHFKETQAKLYDSMKKILKKISLGNNMENTKIRIEHMEELPPRTYKIKFKNLKQSLKKFTKFVKKRKKPLTNKKY